MLPTPCEPVLRARPSPPSAVPPAPKPCFPSPHTSSGSKPSAPVPKTPPLPPACHRDPAVNRSTRKPGLKDIQQDRPGNQVPRVTADRGGGGWVTTRGPGATAERRVFPQALSSPPRPAHTGRVSGAEGASGPGGEAGAPRLWGREGAQRSLPHAPLGTYFSFLIKGQGEHGCFYNKIRTL